MDFICYLHAGWQPLIRPAEATRQWMDNTPEAFAYRCLPLNIANAHGWEILSPSDVDAYWTGGSSVHDVVVKGDRTNGGVSLFGQGILTFHIQALFRTPPGWDLWIGGSPNHFKSGIAPLTGIVETDWSPYTFTMNWKFTRRNHRVSFVKGEPICFIFPIRRDALERMTPRFVTLSDDSDLAMQFRAWSESRDAFQKEVADGRPRAPADKWQKRYYRGVTMRNDDPVPAHRTKVRLKPFASDPATDVPLDRPGRIPEDMDETWLGEVLAATADHVRKSGNDVDLKRRLIELGLPEVVVARLASKLYNKQSE